MDIWGKLARCETPGEVRRMCQGTNWTLVRANEIERLRQENAAWQNQGLLEQCNRQADEIERLRNAVHDLSQAAVDAYDTLEPAGKAGLFDDVWDRHSDVIEPRRHSSVIDTGDGDA